MYKSVMQISHDAPLDLTPGTLSPRSSVASQSAAEYPPYFHAASRRTTLDMALYLARYSDLVLLIHGPAGSGKSTLLREIIARGGPNIHAITMSADPTLTTHAVCDALLNSFKLVVSKPAPDESLALIKEQLDLLQRKGYHCILLIDDADRLTSDTYPFLEALADLRGETGRNLLNLVLFTEHREKITLAGPSVRHRVKATELQPLAPDEVGAYVEHVLRSNHRLDGHAVAFNERDIQRIRRATSGWPGHINTLIEQRSARNSLNPGFFAVVLNHPWTDPRYMLGATSVLAALVLVLVFQDSINYLFERPPVAGQTVNLPPAVTAPVQMVAAPEEKPELVSVNAETPSEVTATVSEPADPVTPVPVEDTPVSPPTPGIPQRDNWLLAQNPDAYTLQVAGSSQEGDIRRALKKFSLTDPSAVFSASRKGKPWYGLVTGVYSDFASAQQARAALPEGLMRGAWVRRMRAVQSEISKQQETVESTEQVTGTTAASPAAAPPQLP